MELKLSNRYYTITGKPTSPGRFLYKDSIPKPEYYPIYDEFEEHQKINYSYRVVKCPCGNDNSYLISTVDREGLEYPLVICRSCGLIRAKYYWDEKSVEDFYSNWFRKKNDGLVIKNNAETVEKIYAYHKVKGQTTYNFLNKIISRLNKPYTVIDIGGGSGGILDAFLRDASCFLIDFNKVLLENARNMGISTVEGGIDQLSNIGFKPDLVILSDVLEHIVDLDKTLTNLKKCLKVGSLLYVRLPGIDSLTVGRRKHDFLGDIHKPHVYYFSLDVLNNLMSRYGFRCLKSNTLITTVYEYTGEIDKLVNYHDVVCSLINNAEIKRKMGLWHIRKLAGKILPRPLVNRLKDRFNQNYLKT